MDTESEVVLRRNREQIMQAWYSQCDPRRVCKLLLILPHIRQISLHSIARMFELRAEQMVQFSDLMGELLESRFSPGRVSSFITHCTYPGAHTTPQTSNSPAEVEEAGGFEMAGVFGGGAAESERRQNMSQTQGRLP
jgi:hypothetical protein